MVLLPHEGHGVRAGDYERDGESGLLLPRHTRRGVPRAHPNLLFGPAFFSAASDPYWANVSALLHLDGANGSTTFTDQTGKTWTRNAGAVISTAQSKFGGASLKCAGATLDSIDSPSSADFTMGTGDFTIEFWLYLSTTSGFQIFVDLRPTSTEGLYPTIYSNGTSLIYYTNSADRITSASLTTANWQFIALSRVSGTTRLFRNGTQVGSSYTDSNNYIGTRLRLGNSGTGSTTPLYDGHEDDVRITKGVGRYSANFTSPTAAFPNS